MSKHFEKDFVKKCKKGDQKALEQLYKETADTLLGVCLRYTKNIQDAEDVFHEGFIKIIKNIKQLKDEKKLISWMIRTMVNTAINYLKKNAKLAEDTFEDSYKYANTIDDINQKDNVGPLLDLIYEEELYELINKLPTGYKVVLNMYAIEGYSHKEIAKALGISESTSKTQYQKAKAKLKIMIEEKLGKKSQKD